MRCLIRGALLGTLFFLYTSFSFSSLFADDQDLIKKAFLENRKQLSAKIPIALSNRADCLQQYNDCFEGYPEGTLIKAISGYVPIESLHIDDKLEGVDGEQEIVSIKKVKKDGIYHYGLTTEQHGFYTYSDGFVHNMDVATIATAQSIVLGAIEIVNPVILLVGSLIPLTVYAVDYYLSSQYEICQSLQEALQDDEVIKETRRYYESKRKELVRLHQELLQFKNNLQVFVKSRSVGSLNFSLSYFSLYNYKPYQLSLLPALAVEQSYCVADKEKLLLLREQELKKLEEEILDIEIALGLHINELVEQCVNIETALFEAMEVIWDYQKIWDGITDYSLIEVSFIRDEYQATFLPVALCVCSELKFQEFNSIIAYYNSLPQDILQKSSNIYSIFQDQIAYNESSLAHIKDCKNLLSNIQSIDEDYLKGVGCFNIQLVSSLQKQAQAYVSEKEHIALAQAKKKKESMKEIQQRMLKESCVAAGSGGPDPDDEIKKFFLNLVKNSIKKARHECFGKFYKDPKTGFWWSKDLARHSGPHYKVFKEGAKGLEWIFDADLLGREIVAKHKGPVGQFIPYKELIFLS